MARGSGMAFKKWNGVYKMNFFNKNLKQDKLFIDFNKKEAFMMKQER